IVSIEAEKTLVRLRPHDVPPWQRGHDFGRPDPREQWRRMRPAGIPVHDFDVVDHHRPAKGGASRSGILEPDDFSSNRHLALRYCWSMIPRVEPEGMLFRKPVSTFRDHALSFAA